MRFNILIGGKAGQGINKVSEILSKVFVKYGYFIFNYRDYQSLIRGGHNFNILSLSDKPILSHESKVDFLIALDDNTLKIHEKRKKGSCTVLSYEKLEGLGRNSNIALAGALVKSFGVDKKILIDEIKQEFGDDAVIAVGKGYNSEDVKIHLKKLWNDIEIMTGSRGAAIGAINSGLNLYINYPMTPATGLSNELADFETKKKDLIVFQSESEIAAINQALGASFAGAITMTGTSGGGFDLMSEGLSMQGQSEIPMTVYLASRPGPSTGIPTYTSQDDLDCALKTGHGEFPRIIVAPGDPIECIEKTNEALYLAEKFGTLSIILTDKHLAESEYSINKKPKKTVKVRINRKIPGEDFIKATSYEHVHDDTAMSSESEEITENNDLLKLEKYKQIEEELQKTEYEAVKFYGNKKSKNLVVSFGSTKGAILDAITYLNCGFLQVLYLKPLSRKIRKIIEGKNVILIEQNLTGQLGKMLEGELGIKFEDENKILKHNGRPFTSDELEREIRKRLR
ncbi:MAG: 2-oxoacid:acceptor oxidoreductase family protein [Nanoarchaeota archaeon]|nr:2-oxoacid:acceptor oxidoreductase family protein [Nanoarchaeota archaeon]